MYELEIVERGEKHIKIDLDLLNQVRKLRALDDFLFGQTGDNLSLSISGAMGLTCFLCEISNEIADIVEKIDWQIEEATELEGRSSEHPES